MALVVVAWHLVPPQPPTPLALDHGLQWVRMFFSLSTCAYVTSPPPHDLPSIMVALFESLWVSYWQGGGMALSDSTATVSGTSYTSCSARSETEYYGTGVRGSTAARQHSSCQSLGCTWLTPAHSSPLLSSPPFTHAPHTHPCGWVPSLCLAGEYGVSVRPSVAW